MKLGTVIEVTESQMTIKNDDGTHALFWRDLRGWNKSLRVGHRVKVFYKHSILAGYLSYKVQRLSTKQDVSNVLPLRRMA